MNRKIKFRVWAKQTKQMFYLDTPRVKWMYSNSAKLVLGDNFHDDYIDGTIEDAEIMQYTGIKDSTGKEIFEGDVVQYEAAGITGTVEWKEHGTGYIVMSLDRSEVYVLRQAFQVIGNGWEQPELVTSVQ